MEVLNEWWGYLHINGKIQVKRFFSMEDIFDAQESPNVTKVSRVVRASDRDEAILKVKKDLDLEVRK